MKKAFCDKCGKPGLHASAWNQHCKSNLGDAWSKSLPVGGDPFSRAITSQAVQPRIEAWLGFHWGGRQDGNMDLDLCGECAVALLDELRVKLLSAGVKEQAKESA